jgi:predicted Zn-dependent peptidase
VSADPSGSMTPSGGQSLVVDGVPVLWAPAPAPFTAGLVFGVGRRDESFVRGGLTHLVEHLAMSALGRTTLDCNASVDLTTTEFQASGRPERVADFLRRVCEALHDLPVDRLAVEAEVLRTENSAAIHVAVGALLAERYGGRGVGLAGYGEPAMTALTPQDVQDWAATRFVRGAAALWLSGPPPEGLVLPLPDGAAPPRVAQALRPIVTPALVEQPVDGAVALGAEVPRLPGLAAACRILADRLEDDLRHRRGLSYTVDTEHVALEADRRFVAVRADCREGQEALAARALWGGLARLADGGPTEAELAHDFEGLQEHVADPRALLAEIQAAAGALVTGVPHRGLDELLQEARSLAPEQVREAAQAIRAGALLGVSAGVELSLPGVTAVPQWSSDVVSGQVHRRRRLRSDAPRGARLVVGNDGVSEDLGGGELQTVRYADALALLELAPGEWTLVGADGVSIPLSAGDWRDGASALDRVRAAVPAELQVAAGALRTGPHRVLLLHAPPYAVGEGLWPSRSDAWLLQKQSWTVVVREQDEVEAYADAAGISAALGRRCAVLVLQQVHEELSVVVMHRGKERDRHVWSGEAHDPSVLAGVLDADLEQVAALLAEPGSPAEVLAAMTRTLGVPEQVAQVLAGVPVTQVPGFVHEPARGVRQSVAATMRGEYDPPDSRKLLHRLNRWERERPPAYRAFNAAAAVGQGVVAAVLASRARGQWSSRTTKHVTVWALAALGSLWSVRPPRPPR